MTVELCDEAIQHAFALDRHQRGGMTERHAHLKARGVACLVFFQLGQDIDAIGIAGLEPPFIIARHPRRRAGERAIAGAILGACAQHHFATGRRRNITGQLAVGVGLAAALSGDGLDVAARFIGIEAADQTLAVGRPFTLKKFYLDRLAKHRLTFQIERDDMEAQLVAGAGPTLDFQTQGDGRRPQRHAGRNRQSFAIGILIFEFGDQGARSAGCRQAGHGDTHAAVFVELQVLDRHRLRRTARSLSAIGAELAEVISEGIAIVLLVAARPFFDVRPAESEIFVVFEGHGARFELGAQLDRRIASATARQIANIDIERHLGRIDLGFGRRLHDGLHRRYAKLFNAEFARGDAPQFATVLFGQQPHFVFAELSLGGNGPVRHGHTVGIETDGH